MKPFIFLLSVFLVSCGKTREPLYSTPETPWPEGLGNHRAVLEVKAPSDALALDILWRRHDPEPDQKKFIIIHQESGDTIKNIHRLQVDAERCQLAFGPVTRAGTYHFYYLPYEVQEGWGFYGKGYLKPEDKADPDWITQNNLAEKEQWKNLPHAELETFQSRTGFDSFYPMEVIALQSEKDALLQIHQNEYLIFPESRKYPIRMLDDIPYKWIKSGPAPEFKGEAHQNEYYALQLGVFAPRKDLEDVTVRFSALQNNNTTIPASRMTCFNTGGTGPYGKPFVKRVDVKKGKVQPLWLGIDIPEDIKAGTYRGSAMVKPANAPEQEVKITLKIDNKKLADRGDSEPWRHSRLRWLNSTLGIDDQPTKPYQAISFPAEGKIQLTGKTITLGKNVMPAGIDVKGNHLLNGPLSFVIETADGTAQFQEVSNFQVLKNKPGIISASWESVSKNMTLKSEGSIESDGYMHYRMTLKAAEPLQIKDIRLEIPLNKEVAQYMMGMGLPGTTVPRSHEAKWEGPHDSFWMGNTDAGLWCELRGSDYHGPLLNLYHPEYPASWFNENKGGFRTEILKDAVKAIVYSGPRELEKDAEMEFEWAMLITPVKEINYQSQFTDRYFHNALAPIPRPEDLKSGIKIVNLHHANNYNPHINYPFIAVDSLKWFVDAMHKKDQKVKIYYTIRELTNYTTELWALRSLGNEILGDGNGGGYPWLREHLIDGYRPQWYQHFPDKSPDASIVNAPGESRWYNYYIEGLAWLVKNMDIDGLYLDDVSYDRRTVKRIRKVMDNTKEGCLIDLHSNTGFSKGPATQYAEFFPYMDKLWFGESFRYDEMPPENWLVEVSGIPFGLMGDMLHGGGNKWLGMLFGMTVRHPWLTEGVTCDPRPVWKIWDQFGIHNSVMTGFWEEQSLINTGNPDVKATTYVKNNALLVALGNFSGQEQTVRLNINWDKIGLDENKVRMKAPEIEDFQEETFFGNRERITIPPRKGWLILVK